MTLINTLFGLSLIISAAYLVCITLTNARTTRRLNALRSNCFVTSERGHRIRYVNASPEVRARAETN